MSPPPTDERHQLATANLEAAFASRARTMAPHPARGIAQVPTFAGPRSGELLPALPPIESVVQVRVAEGVIEERPAGERELIELLMRMQRWRWRREVPSH